MTKYIRYGIKYDGYRVQVHLNRGAVKVFTRTKGCCAKALSKDLPGMINPDCPVCFGIGWVCENHPDRGWDKEPGCECGDGMPGECQRANGLEQPDTSKVIENRD